MFKIPWWKTNFGEAEINRVADSIRHEHLSQGPVTVEFEKQIADIIDVPYVTATTSGSMAILMALMAAGIGFGDEVIIPNRSWIATAHAPLLLGAKIVLVDVENDRPVMDVNKIEDKITPKTKAIIPVHLNGRSVDMEAVNTIAKQHGLMVIEDAAQAFCSTNTDGFLGCQSFAGCFSLSVAKLISTGQGGFVVTRSQEIFEKLKLIRTHGVSDFMHINFTMLGFNFRFTDILASIGIEQLKRLPDRIERVKAVYEKYSSAMDDLHFLNFIPVDIVAGEIPNYVEALCPEREKLAKYLADNSIQTRLFYPDLDTADYFRYTGKFPNSRKYGTQGLYLPCGPDQPLDNISHVLKVLQLYGKCH